jgi:hypothetical protein
MSIAAAATTPTTTALTTSTTRRPLPGGAYPRHRLYQDKRLCGGRAVDLVGTGRPDLDADFGDAQRRRPPIRDEVSCSRWLHGRYSLTTTLRWAA